MIEGDRRHPVELAEELERHCDQVYPGLATDEVLAALELVKIRFLLRLCERNQGDEE